MRTKTDWIASLLFFGIVLTFGGFQFVAAQRAGDTGPSLRVVTLDVTGMT